MKIIKIKFKTAIIALNIRNKNTLTQLNKFII